MEAPLLLSGRAGQEEEQVVHATEVNCPKKPVVDAGVIIDPLSRQRTGGEDTLSSAGDSFRSHHLTVWLRLAPRLGEDRKPKRGEYPLTSAGTRVPPNPPHLLLLKVGRDVEDIPDQQEDPFNQQVVFFLPILPALGKRRKDWL